MRLTPFATAAVLTTISFSAPAEAQNLENIQQLLSTQQCSQCDLSGAGLVMASLPGAQLKGADLTRANLSRANLAGADLRGANLAGASFNGANLTGANLTGANLTGTDLRGAYLVDANLVGVSLDAAYVQGAKGIPNYAGTPEQFHRWGVAEAKEGNYQSAIEDYNRALSLDPEFAPAYLGRGIARYRLGKEASATQDAQIAAQLFEKQQNPSGIRAAQNFIQTMELARKPSEVQSDSGGIGKVIGGVGSLLLKLFL